MNDRTFVSTSAAVALAGAILSGPVGIWVVSATHPQPSWESPAAFVAAYHPIQTLPYLMGMLLVGGFAALIAGLHRVAPEAARARTTTALVLTGAFAAMIFINYSIQTTVVPALVSSASSSDLALVGLLTMVNPKSLGWSLEMWGYAVLGVATWLVAPVFATSRWEHGAKWLFVLNGPVSIASGLATAMRPGWVLSGVGFISFAIWNVLIIAMLALTIASFRARRSAA